LRDFIEAVSKRHLPKKSTVLTGANISTFLNNVSEIFFLHKLALLIGLVDENSILVTIKASKTDQRAGFEFLLTSHANPKQCPISYFNQYLAFGDDGNHPRMGRFWWQIRKGK